MPITKKKKHIEIIKENEWGSSILGISQGHNIFPWLPWIILGGILAQNRRPLAISHSKNLNFLLHQLWFFSYSPSGFGAFCGETRVFFNHISHYMFSYTSLLEYEMYV